MAYGLRSFLNLCFIYALALFYTIPILIRELYRIIRLGPSSYFNKVIRDKRPPILEEGWNHDFATLSKVKLHYVHAGSDDKPLMLFVHGFPEFWYSWRHQLREFEKDYKVVAVDQRGYGESEKPTDKYDYSMELLVQDIRELVTEHFKKEKCILVAHDWGAAVAWMVALLYPDIVDRLIVLSVPHPKVFAKTLKTSWGQFMKSWYMFFFQISAVPEMLLSADDYSAIIASIRSRSTGCVNRDAINADDVEAWKYSVSQPGSLTAMINWYRSAMIRIHPVPMPKPAICQPPTLMIHGSHDPFLSQGMMEASQPLCQDSQVKILPVSHWIQQDAPKEVNQSIREFLEENKQN